MKLTEILRDSNYKFSQFEKEGSDYIERLENNIFLKEVRGKEVPFINCLVRRKDIQLKPEEVVRQLYLMVLNEQYGYSFDRMGIEYALSFGREKKRADIVIFDKQDTRSIYIMVELKNPKLKDGKEQLKSYCNATGAPIGVWSNGESISFYHRKDPNYFEDLSAIPSATEKLSDILTERWTIDDLVKKDKLVAEKKSLKDLILEMEDEVLANAGVDVFEELFKLIFTKLYDEMESGRNKTRHLRFRNYGDTETELKDKIQDVFDNARNKWEGVFTEDSKIMLTPSHLSVCVSSLQDVKLFNSNLDVVDEAFEYLIGKSSKGEKGQYFTPRYVIDMCVKMMNPQKEETVIDTASGSCGFPVHSIFHVWEQILKEKGMPKSHLFTAEEKPTECTDYVRNKVFAIDFDEKAVRVSRTLNLIAGDGQTNVLHLNTLDYERWDEKIEDEDWQETYYEGWKKLRKLRTTKNSNRDFVFDVLMANPPFAGDIKESRILAKYELGKKPNGKYQTKVGRDILFIERNLDFLKPGGRMAVVLPQGRFNNSLDKNIRDYIAEKCRILGVVGLHGNVFKPHTGTKTSVLFIQKWDDILCPKKEDYPIFFATQQEPSKDNSGEKIFVKKKDFPKNAASSKEENPKIKGLNNLPYLKTFRKKLRNNLTPAEAKLWTFIKEKQLEGRKFRRQHSVANYILDFYCPSESIAIELDGEVHNNAVQAEYDRERDLFLNHCGIKVLRFENKMVFENPHGLLQTVKDEFGWKNNHPTLSGTPPYKEGGTFSVAEPIDHYNETPENLDEYLLDSHGHLIVKHDLFNHDNLTQDGIAEAFIEFAKKEKLSFVQEGLVPGK